MSRLSIPPRSLARSSTGSHDARSGCLQVAAHRQRRSRMIRVVVYLDSHPAATRCAVSAAAVYRLFSAWNGYAFHDEIDGNTSGSVAAYRQCNAVRDIRKLWHITLLVAHSGQPTAGSRPFSILLDGGISSTGRARAVNGDGAGAGAAMVSERLRNKPSVATCRHRNAAELSIDAPPPAPDRRIHLAQQSITPGSISSALLARIALLYGVESRRLGFINFFNVSKDSGDLTARSAIYRVLLRGATMLLAIHQPIMCNQETNTE